MTKVLSISTAGPLLNELTTLIVFLEHCFLQTWNKDKTWTIAQKIKERLFDMSVQISYRLHIIIKLCLKWKYGKWELQRALNFEDRRCIEGVSLCAMHHGPSVSCPEFKPRDKKIDSDDSYNKFCLNCSNYECIDGISICTKDHRPGAACYAFRKKSESMLMIAWAAC